MAGIYIYSDKSEIVSELIGFAKGAGQKANVIALTNKDAEEVKCFGAEKVYVFKGESPIAENYSKAIAEFLKSEGADLFAVGATARGRDLAARVAGYIDCGMASDVSSVSYADGIVATERMIYGGAVTLSEKFEDLSVVTIPAGKFEATQGEVSPIIEVEFEADRRVSLAKTVPIVKEGGDISAADKVVCVGMGVDKQQDIQIAKDLADVLGAEIGCSRGIAEERHWLPVEQYIGISGAVIKPQLYISMGISGQVQHTVGIRDAKIIVAINTNEKAPIFNVADYGIVGDMYKIIPMLTEALRDR